MNKNEYPTNEAIQAFESDLDKLGKVCDMEGWYVTEQWAEKFRCHLHSLLPLAESGDVAAQYTVAVIYMLGCLYTSEEEMISRYEVDSKLFSNWLDKAAGAGHYGAIDNLIVLGVSMKADELRKALKNACGLENAPPTSKGWERDMEKLYKWVFGSSE